MTNHLAMPLLLLLLALLTPSLLSPAIAAPSTPDPTPHTDLNNWFFPPAPAGFLSGAKLASLRQINSVGLSSNTTLVVQAATSSDPTTAVYRHDGSSVSTIAAIRRAVSEGPVDVLTLDVACTPTRQINASLAAAVEQARLGGTVVLCEGSPRPVPVTVVRGGVAVNVSMVLTNTGGQAGAAYSSRVQGAGTDLDIYVVPRTLVFGAAGQASQNVTVTVRALGSGAEGSGAKPPTRWREAIVEWTGADGSPVEDWPFVIRVS